MKENPFNFFDKIYCINLPTSKKRWNDVNKEFKKISIDDRIIQSSAPAPASGNLYLPNMRKAGQYGCTMSHLKTIGRALHEANGNILILEDDIKFNTETVRLLNETIKNLPQAWDILYLGGQPVGTINKISTNTFSVNDMRGSYGYAIKHTSIIDLHHHIIDSLMKNSNDVEGIYDYILGNFSKNKNSFCSYPLIVTPTITHSIIQNGIRNYDEVIKSQWNKFI